MYCTANISDFLPEGYCAGPGELKWDTEPRFGIQLGYSNPLGFVEKNALIDQSVGINMLIRLFKVINMIIHNTEVTSD